MIQMNQNNQTAFIIGNGPSRKDFDLSLCEGHGLTYGCNAIFRDFTPDWLVAIDRPIIEEIENSDFPHDRFFVPPTNDQYEPIEYTNSPTWRPRMNAGMVAMKLAIEHGARVLYCIGFDFILASEEGLGNIFAGTPCYEPGTSASPSDHANRARFLKWFMTQNPEVLFKFVVSNKWRWIGLRVFDIQTPNVTFMTIGDLINHISTLNGK